jgi:hypothetical protein
MTEIEPRKASDILLSLEDKVNTLTKIISVYDYNTKIILDRVNKIYAYIDFLQKEEAALAQQNAQPVQSENDLFPQYQEKEIVQTSTEHMITEEKEPKGHRRTARSETYATDTKQVGGSEKKIPVIQRITDHTGKDIFMAEVSILNENNEIVCKTKTNAVGKWQAHLKTGNYTVSVVKTDTSTKKKIEAMQDIVVNDNTPTMTLPTAVIKR